MSDSLGLAVSEVNSRLKSRLFPGSLIRWDRRRFSACVAAIAAAWMTVLGARYVVLGFADVRGGLGLGVDEGTLLSSAYAAGDVVGVVIGCWLATALSLRRVLLGATLLFMATSVLMAFSPPYAAQVIVRFAQGMAGGVLLPMAIVALLRTLPARHRALALALYTSASTLAPQLAAAITGWLLDHWGWRALFLANLLPGIFALIAGFYGLPRERLRLRPLLHMDRFGMLLFVGGLGMLACAFDQGNRLDWLQATPIRVLLFAGTVAICGFIYHVVRVRHDRLLNVELLSRRNIVLGISGILPFSVAVTGCSYVIPQFLIQIHSYHPRELGAVLWDAGWPQLISFAGAVVCLDRKWLGGPRRLLVLGGVLVATGALHDSLNIDGSWEGDELRIGQILQGLGLPLILLPLLYLYVGDLLPREGLHAAMVFNVMRSICGTAGLAWVSTLDRVREQTRSNVLMDHVSTSSAAVSARLDALISAVSMRSSGSDQATEQALHLLASNVRLQSQILAHADTLAAIAVVTLIGAVLAAFMMPYGSGHPSSNVRHA